MSKMYREQRRRGMPKRTAFRRVGLAKAISKKMKSGKQKWIKKKYPYQDFDCDGKVNKYDCQPLNKYKQDSYSKAMQSYLEEQHQRLDNQDIEEDYDGTLKTEVSKGKWRSKY